MNPPLPVLGGLPHINRPLDNTALAAYQACPREYFMAMVLHRRPAGLSPALAYGKAMHKALEHHYRTGGNTGLVEHIVRREWENHDAADDYRTLERVILDYRRYCDHYGNDPSKEQGSTVGWPDHPMVEVSSNAMGGALVHPWAVKIDRIVEIGGLTYVEDHKTTSRLDRNFYSGFELSQQMMGYCYVAQQLLPSHRIAGVRINVIHCLKTGTNFERRLFSYSPQQMEEWARNTNGWMVSLDYDCQVWQDTILDEDGRIEDWPLGHFGDNGCSRKYGMCSFHRVCSSSPRVRQAMLEQEFSVNPWNPLEVEDASD